MTEVRTEAGRALWSSSMDTGKNIRRDLLLESAMQNPMARTQDADGAEAELARARRSIVEELISYNFPTSREQ